MDEYTFGIWIPQESNSNWSWFCKQCNGSIHHSNDSCISKPAKAWHKGRLIAICNYPQLNIYVHCHCCTSEYYVHLQALSVSELPFENYSLHLGSYREWSSQLHTVVFRSFPISVNELTLMKFVLACSPLLKKLYVKRCTMYVDQPHNVVMNWELARELLRLCRASPTAVVEFV